MPVVVCFGDSNTWGADPRTMGRYPLEQRWPGVVALKLGPEWRVIEEGLPGRTTIWEDPFVEGMAGRPYLLPCVRSHAPVDAVVIALGTNDLKAVYRLDANEIARGVGTLVNIVRSSRCGPGGSEPKVLVVVPPPLAEPTERSRMWGFGASRATSRELPRAFAAMAEVEGAEMVEAGSIIETSAVDGVHLDSAAHAILAREIGVRLAAMLTTAPDGTTADRVIA